MNNYYYKSFSLLFLVKKCLKFICGINFFIHLKVGFNAGNGSQSYEYKPYSQATTLRDLTSRGWANGFPGRHIFRIDEKIMLGTCNKDIGKSAVLLRNASINTK